MESLARTYYFRFLRQFIQLKRFFKLNPGFLPLAIYLVTSAAGLFYLTHLISYFGFDGLKHIGLGDFFTVIFSSMGLLLTFMGVFIIGVFYIRLDKYFSSIQFLSICSLLFKLNRPYLKAPLLTTYSAAIIVVFAQAYNSANLDASEIKHSQHEMVKIGFNYPIVWLGKKTLMLDEAKVIATTNRYAFIYHPQTKKSVVVPLTNIATIFNTTKGAEDE